MSAKEENEGQDMEKNSKKQSAMYCRFGREEQIETKTGLKETDEEELRPANLDKQEECTGNHELEIQ